MSNLTNIKFHNFSLSRLRHRCRQDFKSITQEFGEPSDPEPGWRYWFQDNGASILGVAHLDTVQKHNHFQVVNLPDDRIVYNCQLDDRLGLFILADVLYPLGLSFDILLTEGEEQMASTAALFQPPEGKAYNWMFSFDRSGTDLVMYQYHSKDWEKLFKDTYKLWSSHGSYSDIADLDHLGIVGFNWGCGYEDNHSAHSHVSLADTARMINTFVQFYADYREVPMPYVPVSTKRTVTTYKDGKTTTVEVDDSLVDDYAGAYGWYGQPRHRKKKQRGDTDKVRGRFFDGYELYECDYCGYSVPDYEFLFSKGICTHCDEIVKEMAAEANPDRALVTTEERLVLPPVDLPNTPIWETKYVAPKE